MQLSLADRTFLVTGGGSGIGKGVAAAVVAAGGNVMIVGRNADRLSDATAAIRAQVGDGAGSVRHEPADVTNEDEVAHVVDAATTWNGGLHGVVHCAGWITGQVINVDGGHGLRRGPDMSAMLEPVFGADGLRGVVRS